MKTTYQSPQTSRVEVRLNNNVLQSVSGGPGIGTGGGSGVGQ